MTRRLSNSFCLLFLSIVAFHAAALGADPRFTLNKGDHICLIGNTLAERMQHDGWLETLLHSRFPTHELVFRSLAFSGDELVLRLRSAGFGDPDQHLASHKADVIFAFFGYNESFAGPERIEAFKKDLASFIQHTLSQKYNGKTPPRLVLFSPIAHENLRNPDLPDGSENNARLEPYTQAMAEVARDHGVLLVDLFHPTREAYAAAPQPLTINGIHLNEEGNRLLALVIDRALLPHRAELTRDPLHFDQLRAAVRDKSFYWFNRYRTVDGYSIYGGRADLKFVDDQTNRDVMQREMEVLDVMTANRDRRVWAAAQGRDLAVDDSNTPPFIPVKTNKPGPGPNGAHVFLGGEEAIGQMQVAKGMQVNLFASEEMFPELVNPVQMAFDTRGRLWVAAWLSYPHWKPKEEMNDKLLILDDTNGDGRADTCQTFVGGLHNPTGFEFYSGGVIVAMAPDLLFVKDTDGDDKADVRQRILHGLDSADTHHTANSFVLDPGGALYFQEGTFHHTQVETPYRRPVRSANAAVYRYEPHSHRFDVYVSYPFANPHGHAFDRWGQDIVHDGTGAVPYHAALFSGHVEFPYKHPQPPTVYAQRTRPCPATEILSSRHFPEENQGHLLVGNVIGLQGILQYQIADDGSSFVGTETEPILQSTDPNFRPVDMEIGPDGALYFTDWQNPIIGHMQHNLRDPSRDRTHGRVYRMTYPSRPLLEPAKIAGASLEQLLDLLKEPENRVRYRAKIELSARDRGEVIAALEKWMQSFDRTDAQHEHHLLEALWLFQYHNVVNVSLLDRMLDSPDFRARAAATRVLCYWRDRLPDSLGRLKKLAADKHPRVRLEAVRAASFYSVAEAVEVPLISSDQPSDKYLDFARSETMKALEPYWKKALAEGQPIAVTSDAAMRILLSRIETEELLKMNRSRAVYLELLLRSGVRDEYRQEALAGLAKLDGKSDLRVLLDAIKELDQSQENQSVVYDHVRLLTGRSPDELSSIHEELQNMAMGAKLPLVRQIGYVALVTADRGVERAWELANHSPAALRDLLAAMPLIPDASAREALYPHVEPLLHRLPPQLDRAEKHSEGTYGRYVRVELPGERRTLTLAEVEVLSRGSNVARQGKASQKNTSQDGEARRGLDGNTSGNYGDGGQTRTEEETPDPWWEVDLGEECPIDSLVIYNRTDGSKGKRLDGFTLLILDNDRNVVDRKENVPAPLVKVELQFKGGNLERLVRRAAMNAMTSVRGREPQTFKTLAQFIQDGVDRAAAIHAVQRVPRQF